MMRFYSRPGCTLCDKAELLLQQAGIPYTKIDISGQPDLEADFGWEIPVLQDQHGVRLKGIFTWDDVLGLKE